MSLSVYKGKIIKKEIVQSNRLRAALEAEIGMQCVPLQLTVSLTHFKDLSELSTSTSWLPCGESDEGTIYPDLIAEYMVALTADGKTYIKTLAGASEVDLGYDRLLDDSFNDYVEVEFICPDIELGAKYRKDGQQIRNKAPHLPGSRRLWRLENCLLSNICLKQRSNPIPVNLPLAEEYVERV